MPSRGQIIPKFLHPHDEVYINDNTVYTDVTDDNTPHVRYLCVFGSSKGRDRLMNFKNFSKWVDEYGQPNFRLYGQAPYMPYTMLYTGSASCQCLRVTASDSTFANLIVLVGYKKDTAKHKLVLKYKLMSRENLRKASDLEAVANSLETETEDSDGYKWMPIMTFWALGHGKYGNDFRVRITHDKGADKSNIYKNYIISVLSTERDAEVIETFNAAFYIEAMDSFTYRTLYAEEVINDEHGTGSQKINMEFFHDNYLRLYDLFAEVYNNSDPAPVKANVDRLPAITLPSTTAVYNLTASDGTNAPGLYVYSSGTGLFQPSTYTIEDVAALPVTLDPAKIYRLTAVDGVRPIGSTWVDLSGSTVAGPEIIPCVKLPATTLYTAGIVYHLTTIDDGKPAGSEWIYDSNTNGFIAYVPTVVEHDPIDLTAETFDIFGYNRITRKANAFIEIDGGTASLSLMNLEGVALQNGSDGSLDESKDDATRTQAYNDALIRAFDGAQDSMILNKRRAPVDQIYDAAFPITVKKGIAALAIKRADALCYLDTGLVQTTADVLTVANQLKSIDSYLISFNSGMMYTHDPISGKNIPVSILMWMAASYPSHVLNYGWHTPFAGERYAVISGYSHISKVKPVYDEEMDAETLEHFYDDNHMNYLQSLDETTIIRGTQITCQSKTSDLSKENNVMLTLEIKRKIERLISQNRYNWTDADSIKDFQSTCAQVFSTYEGSKCSSLKVRVAQTEWEKTRYILHAYLELVFRKYQERGIVEIDLNPSVSAS